MKPIKQRVERRENLQEDSEGKAITERRKQLRRTEEHERWERFGTWVRDRRLALGRSQSLCSQAAGIQPAQWSRIESAVYGTPYGKMVGIATALEVDVAQACSQAGYAPPHESREPMHAPIMLQEDLATKGDIESLRGQLQRIQDLLFRVLGSGEIR